MTAKQDSVRSWARWLGTFVGFPLAGVAARLAVGGIDGLGPAMVGGALGGAVLGLVQAAVGGVQPARRARWVGATSLGLAAGLAAGGAAVGYRTDTMSLVTLGLCSGAGVGLAQAAAMAGPAAPRLRWMAATPLLWGAAWAITSQVIVDAHRQHAVFGSSGALFVSALSGLLVVRGAA